jgi:adenosine deaminase
MSEHNLKRLLDRGLCVTVNSDDPAYFGGYIRDNFLAVCGALSLSEADVLRLAHNAVQASFLPEIEQQALRDRMARAAIAGDRQPE